MTADPEEFAQPPLHLVAPESSMPPRPPQTSLPYFSALTRLLDAGQPAIRAAFGHHVHWGYWADPERAGTSAAEFGQAADALSLELFRIGDLADGQRVLDAGCGFGGTLRLLGERYRGMQLTGLNIDHQQLVRALRPATPGQTRARFVQGDACRLPFPDGSFDRILAVECIFHFPGREAFFREALRTLAPGGRLALSDFLPAAPFQPATTLMALWPTPLRFYGRCDFSCTLAGYRRLARRLGFHVAAERDITRHTLPTYRFLRTLGPIASLQRGAAVTETLAAEAVSRLGLLRYELLAFDRPG